jgi:hypothetical protein
MYSSKFAPNIENMLVSLRNAGLQVAYINYFLADFDQFCLAEYPTASLLTAEISEKWIHSTCSKSKAHMSRRVRTMKHVGEYQQSLGKPAYVPDYVIKYAPAEGSGKCSPPISNGVGGSISASPISCNVASPSWANVAASSAVSSGAGLSPAISGGVVAGAICPSAGASYTGVVFTSSGLLGSFFAMRYTSFIFKWHKKRA